MNQTRSIKLQNTFKWINDPNTGTTAALAQAHTLFFFLIYFIRNCFSETNSFIFLNPQYSMGSLCGSGPQGFRLLTKHILLLLCCLPTMLFTYRRTSGSVQMNQIAWLSLTQPFHRQTCWMNRNKSSLHWHLRNYKSNPKSFISLNIIAMI